MGFNTTKKAQTKRFAYFAFMVKAPGEKRYKDYSSFIKNHFGERVQKISINAGFTCPNRDGSKSYGGCTYCNNSSFNPDYCLPTKSITQQINEGVDFFSRRRGVRKYLAYFQSYTNTYGDLNDITNLYSEAARHPHVVGLVIGTRPDCINEEILDFLALLAKDHYISLEMGVESTLNRTLASVNRCHTFEDTVSAFELATNRGIHLGAHLILGLPGESRAELLKHATQVSALPIETLKVHHLQILKHTIMAAQWKKNPAQFDLFDLDAFLDLITDFIGYLREDIIIERFINQAPHDLLIAPKWNGLKNFEIVNKIEKLLRQKDIWQGKYYTPPNCSTK